MYINYKNTVNFNHELRNHHIIQHILDINNIDHPFDLISKYIEIGRNTDVFLKSVLVRGTLTTTAKRFSLSISSIRGIFYRFLRDQTKKYYYELGRD